MGILRGGEFLKLAAKLHERYANRGVSTRSLRASGREEDRRKPALGHGAAAFLSLLSSDDPEVQTGRRRSVTQRNDNNGACLLSVTNFFKILSDSLPPYLPPHPKFYLL